MLHLLKVAIKYIITVKLKYNKYHQNQRAFNVKTIFKRLR